MTGTVAPTPERPVVPNQSRNDFNSPVYDASYVGDATTRSEHFATMSTASRTAVDEKSKSCGPRSARSTTYGSTSPRPADADAARATETATSRVRERGFGLPTTATTVIDVRSMLSFWRMQLERFDSAILRARLGDLQ